MTDLYRRGQHPYWCELGGYCSDPEDPRHEGRTSILYGQSDEARLTVQLVRIDDTVPAGTRPGETKVALGLSDMTGLGQDGKPLHADAHLSIDEAQALQLVLSQYVDFARREDVRRMLCTDAETIRTQGPA